MLFRLNRTKKLKKGPVLSVPSLACIASVSSRSRGSSRKLGQEQKKKWMTGEGAKPFFCFRSNFRAINRLETLATQAMPSQPASASVFNRVIAQKLEREHFIPLFCTCPDFLDELARKSLLHRPVTSRKLQSRTVVALFPFSPLQYTSLPVTSKTWPPWRLCGPHIQWPPHTVLIFAAI